MRQEIMQRAMQAFASMDIDAARRCLGVVETTAEFFPMSEEIDCAPLSANQFDMLATPASHHYGMREIPTAPFMGAAGLLGLTRMAQRKDLN